MRHTWECQRARTDSSLIVLFWSKAPPLDHDPGASVDPVYAWRLADARALGKPVRVLCLDDEPIPAEAFAGIADLQMARVRTTAEAIAQCRRWVEERP